MRWRVTLAAATVLALAAAMAAAPVGASHGMGPHGYCDEKGNPVITDWPEHIPRDFGRVECRGDQLTYIVPDINDYSDSRPPTTEVPNDWAGFVNIVVNGQLVINPYDDVEPYVVRGTGRTLVPIRYVTEAIGGSVTWEHQTKTVSLSWNGRETIMSIGHQRAKVNGIQVTLDQPPLIWKNRTFVPIRMVAEAFGANVEWRELTYSVFITLPGATCAPRYCP